MGGQFHYIAQQVLNALQLATFYVPLAMAFALIQAITKRVFLSFGDVTMFGSFAAVVANVDDSLLLPSEVSDPIVATEPVYRVRARLRHEAVNAYGKTLPLRAGLAFEADVILDKRSLLRWLLDPLFSLRGRL